MTDNVRDIERDGLQKIEAATTLEALDVLEKEFFGRKHGSLTEELRALGNLSEEERKKRGAEVNRLKQTLEAALVTRRATLEGERSQKLAEEDALDVTMDLPPKLRGHLHLIPEFIEQVGDVFGRMGFEVVEGPEIDTEEHNFDLLNFPKDHAARDAQDIFYIKDGGTPDNRLLLRGHTSTVQIRYMKTHKPPFRMICPGKVYRKDADATHSPMFHQFEGLMIGKDVSLRNMQYVMTEAVKELVAPDLSFRFRAGYFPFVEPGLEMDIQWRGELTESREGRWLEVAGCGMVHPNVLENCGINPKGSGSGTPRQSRLPWQGFAFGFGVERLLMIKHRIPDIRLFFENDLRFLEQF
jgi:phenylalanyl-tRNA synthetase alpha chain